MPYVRSIHGPWLLYDNQADPYQMHNLIGKSEARELQSRLNRSGLGKPRYRLVMNRFAPSISPRSKASTDELTALLKLEH